MFKPVGRWLRAQCCLFQSLPLLQSAEQAETSHTIERASASATGTSILLMKLILSMFKFEQKTCQQIEADSSRFFSRTGHLLSHDACCLVCWWM